MSLPASHPRTRPISAGHLRAFDAVARHLNFRAAADELSLTQSAVSRQIQGLEDEVGCALFLRHTRAVELTSAGAQLQRAPVLRAQGLELDRQRQRVIGHPLRGFEQGPWRVWVAQLAGHQQQVLADGHFVLGVEDQVVG